MSLVHYHGCSMEHPRPKAGVLGVGIVVGDYALEPQIGSRIVGDSLPFQKLGQYGGECDVRVTGDVMELANEGRTWFDDVEIK